MKLFIKGYKINKPMTAVDMLCPPVWTNLSDCGRTIGKIHPDDEQK